MSERRSITDAIKEGLHISYSHSQLLQLDLDDYDSGAQYAVALPILASFIGPYRVRETVSKSGNRHVHIKTVRRFSVVERIALQSLLGSDRKREALSLIGHYDAKEDPLVLFETSRDVIEWAGSGEREPEEVK